MSVNKAILIGRLGKDPEVRQFQSGDKIATASLATSERWADKQTGERKEHTEWHTIQFQGKLVDVASQYLKKGSQIYVDGKIKTRKWQDNQGQDRYSTYIQVENLQMLDSSQNNTQNNAQQPPQFGTTGQVNNQFNQQFAQPQYQGQQGYPQPSPQTAMQRPAVNNSDIPF
ncbi:single-stranded DNA-binding protein [Moraxella sp. ZJ142]|uniref:single-stranded DNA-binding protein n=1 Tax=Moraxella marmotae TaxID=3344520 RepID=UPI0035D45FC6